MPFTCMPPPPHASTVSSQNDWVIMAMDGAAKMTVNSQHYDCTVMRQNDYNQIFDTWLAYQHSQK